MRNSSISLVVVAIALSGCGSGPDGAGTSAPVPSGAEAFNPAPPPAGYTRITAATVKDVPPGGDVTYCQYVMPPLDHDVDVLAVSGYQSKFGHHAAAFVYTPQAGEEPGSNFPCMGTEFSSGGPDGGSSGGSLSMGTYLGAVAGADTGSPPAAMPEGVAFRLNKGNGVMLNVHYLNVGDKTIDGNAVVDLKLADTDPSRKIAAMFINLDTGFDLTAATESTSSVDCVAQTDLQLIMMSNHMHEFGTSALSEVRPAAGGPSEELHRDTTWSFDMQFNPVFSKWDTEAPFLVHAGDTVRTTCNWDNTTAASMKFPREMCVGVAFALTTGDHPTVPMCANGQWIAAGL
ncbi:MAG TPA: hypothetical protein VF395_21905 [Polyangiaceae bacterium]